MKRRDFLMRSGAVSLAVAVPIGSVVMRTRATLLEDPRAYVGEAFVSAEGVRMRLAEVTGFRLDAHTMQAHLQFEVMQGDMPPEGSHLLSGAGTEETVFLQRGQRGPVACINRLHRSLV